MLKQRHSKYYEAILQIRPATDDVMQFILGYLESRKDCQISNTAGLKTGIDLYLTSQRVALALGKKMKEHFKGSTLKISRSIHHRDRFTSKDVYQVTVLFRLPKQAQE